MSKIVEWFVGWFCKVVPYLIISIFIFIFVIPNLIKDDNYQFLHIPLRAISLLIIVIAIAFYILFARKIKGADDALNKISSLFLAAFFGVFLALQINNYSEFKKDEKNYKALLNVVYIEIARNISDIAMIKKDIDSANLPVRRLSNLIIDDSLQNYIVRKFLDLNDAILLYNISQSIKTCNKFLDLVSDSLRGSVSDILSKNKPAIMSNLGEINVQIGNFVNKPNSGYKKFIDSIDRKKLEGWGISVYQVE